MFCFASLYIFKGVCLWPVKTQCFCEWCAHTHTHTSCTEPASLTKQLLAIPKVAWETLQWKKLLEISMSQRVFCVELIQRQARLHPLSQNQSQRPRQLWEANEGGRIYGKPLTRHSVTGISLPPSNTLSTPLPKKEKGGLAKYSQGWDRGKTKEYWRRKGRLKNQLIVWKPPLVVLLVKVCIYMFSRNACKNAFGENTSPARYGCHPVRQRLRHVKVSAATGGYKPALCISRLWPDGQTCCFMNINSVCG